jgi:hypothetical protein
LIVTKSDGSPRFCFDGRKFNAITKKDSYPLPLVDRILSMLRDSRYISSLDLKSAFWQIPLEKSSREKTAFSVPGCGFFHFCRMPYGLSNAAQTQQRLMDRILGPELEPNVFVFLDDIIICSKTFEEHVQLLKEVNRRLSDANLTLNLKKCKFFRESLHYLGFVVDKNGLKTDPEKIAAVTNYPIPTNSTELKRLLGLCSWYRRFIPHFSSIAAPLNNFLKNKGKKLPINLDPAALQAFDTLKKALVSAPILSLPDFSLPFTIQCDASGYGIGAALTQIQDGAEHVIAYASRTLSKTERNYSVGEREALAVIFVIEKFRATWKASNSRL